jgi:hypothetical protein
MILCLETLGDNAYRTPAHVDQQENERGGIEHHSLAIASICFSPGVEDGVLVVAVNPLFYGASRYSPFRDQHVLTSYSCEAHCFLATEEEDMGAP